MLYLAPSACRINRTSCFVCALRSPVTPELQRKINLYVRFLKRQAASEMGARSAPATRCPVTRRPVTKRPLRSTRARRRVYTAILSAGGTRRQGRCQRLKNRRGMIVEGTARTLPRTVTAQLHFAPAKEAKATQGGKGVEFGAVVVDVYARSQGKSKNRKAGFTRHEQG